MTAVVKPIAKPIKKYEITLHSLQEASTMTVSANYYMHEVLDSGSNPANIQVNFYRETPEEISKFSARYGLNPPPVLTLRAFDILSIAETTGIVGRLRPIEIIRTELAINSVIATAKQLVGGRE
jgi:hypothetical protein